jgi:hypothetical protein
VYLTVGTARTSPVVTYINTPSPPSKVKVLFIISIPYYDASMVSTEFFFSE